MQHSAPHSPNQEIWIEAIPDPDKVLLDADAKAPDASDMQHAFVFEWGSRAEVGKKRDAVLPQKTAHRAAASSSADLEWTGAGGEKPTGWTAGDQELLAEYWSLDTTPRPLLLIRAPAAPARPPMLRPGMPGLTPGMMPPSGMLPPPGMLPPGMPPPGPLPPYPPPGGPPMPPSPGMPPPGQIPGLAPPRLTGPGGPPPLPEERAVFEWTNTSRFSARAAGRTCANCGSSTIRP